MRPAFAAAFVALLAVVASIPAEAAPLPGTRAAARALVNDSLDDADRSAAAALAEARLLVQGAKGAALRNGALDVRAKLVQPVVHGSGDFLSVLWAAGGAERPWTGAYWIETSAGATTPNLIQLYADGALFFLGEKPLGPLDQVDVTYHFLGTDGKHEKVALGRAPILAFAPEAGPADLGGAAFARENGTIAGLFLTPWNLLGRDARMGITVAHEDGSSSEIILDDCAAGEGDVVEAGCRQLYALPVGPDPSSVTLWHLDEEGARVTDRTLTRAKLDGGYVFAS